MRDQNVCVTVGEIKSAKGKHEAVEQLVKRLVVIGSATKKIAKVVSDTLTRLDVSSLAAELHISVDMCKI